ncbi:MAG: hypothetical protein WCP65_01400 [Bacteroidota bacterium]
MTKTISKVKVVSMTYPSYSKIRFYEKSEDENNTETCFYEEEGMLNVILAKYGISNDNDSFDVSHLIKKQCIARKVDGKIVSIEIL